MIINLESLLNWAIYIDDHKEDKRMEKGIFINPSKAEGDWEALYLREQDYTLYASDSRWAGRYILLSRERKTYGGGRVTRSAYLDQRTSNYKYIGVRKENS